MFEGTYTALITPFTKNGIDIPALKSLIEEQIEKKVSGIVPAGTTGESPTLSSREQIELIEMVVKYVKNRIPVIAGTGANSTKEAIELTKKAEKAGADASLQVAPYYNKPSQEGIYQHFKSIARESSLPLILYSIPGRCGVEIEVETCRRLAEEETIQGLKEASGSCERINQLYQVLPKNFSLLSGDDNLTIPFMSLGAKGVISVAANIIPETMVEIVNFCRENQYQEALKLHQEFYPLLSALMKLDINPIPIKMAASLMGKCQPIFRLPLVPATEEKRHILKETLNQYGLLK